LIIIAGNKAGPDRATTTVGEDVSLSLRAGGKVRASLIFYKLLTCANQPAIIKSTEEAEPTAEEKMRINLAKAGAGKVVCRLCKGGHFTAKCPYKDSLPVLEGTGIYRLVLIPLDSVFDSYFSF
jgi:translation initiation factor 3 subunit G